MGLAAVVLEEALAAAVSEAADLVGGALVAVAVSAVVARAAVVPAAVGE